MRCDGSDARCIGSMCSFPRCLREQEPLRMLRDLITLYAVRYGVDRSSAVAHLRKDSWDEIVR